MHVDEVGRPVHAARRVRVGEAHVVVVDAHVLAVNAAGGASEVDEEGGPCGEG